MPAPTPHGVALEQYAGVDAAVAEGHPLEAVLAQEQVPLELWPQIDLAFKDAITADGEIFSDYCRKRVEAEDHLGRRVRPIDEDLRAWMGFLAALGASESGAFLKKHGLTNGDVGRLTRAWQRRFDANEKLRAQADLLLESPPAAPNAIMPEPAVLRPFPWTTPTPSAAPPAARPASTPPPPSELPPFPMAPPVPNPGNAGHQIPLMATPGPAPRVVIVPRQPDRIPLGSTAHGAIVNAPALPFQGKRAAPALAAVPAEPAPQRGGTIAMPVMPDLREGPAREQVPSLAQTAAGSAPSQHVVPFSGQRPPPAPVAHLLEPAASLGETEDATSPRPSTGDPLAFTLDPSNAPRPSALPFHSASPAPPPGTPPTLPQGMKVDDYARLCAECELHPPHRAALLARWGLTLDQHDRLRAAFEGFFAARPQARQSWEKMLHDARRMLRGG